jgi:gliding motility-associated-like protein
MPILFRPLALSLFAFAMTAQAQQLIPTRGKEFWFGFMQNYTAGAEQHLYVYVSSDQSTTGTMSSPLVGWSIPFNVTADNVTQLEVPITNMHMSSDVVDSLSVLIETADTVAVYALNFQSFTADASVIYPTRSLGTDYRVQAYQGLQGFEGLNSEFLIVATEDSTEIVITPACNTLGGNAAGVPFTIVLDKGRTFQVQAASGELDLTGSTIVATPESGGCRPFAVFSGSACTNVPSGCFACDHVFEQDLPTPFWGTSYFLVPWEGPTAYTYRILAQLDNTTVTVDADPPISLDAGQYVEVNGTADPHCIQSDLPISVAQFMQGSDCSGSSGDPALLLVNAEDQKIDDITFATVLSNNITEQYINVVVEQSDAAGVVLDGVPVASAQFTPFPACPDRVYARLSLTQGSHRISCANGLTGYVYGTGPNYETYAYSVGSFTPLPVLPFDTVFCGLDTADIVTLSPPVPVFNPVWTVESAPDDTLFQGLTYTFQPSASDIYVVTGTENVSGCTQQYFFSVELGQPPATQIVAPASVCAYAPAQLDLQLTPPGTYVYAWTPEAGLNAPDIQDPVASPAHDTWYHVTVSSPTGCVATEDSVLVTVTPGNVVAVQAAADPALICGGQGTQLDVAVQRIIGSDDFDDGVGTLWESVQGGASNNICGAVAGNALRFNEAGPRVARTVPLDVSTGGVLRFALKIANGGVPCEDVDPGENILVEYSLNGSSWTIMATYVENQFPEFGSVILNIPGPAQSTNTRFRWRQLLNSGAGQDNWVLDDVAIGTEDATGITFSWSPTSGLSDPAAQDPTAAPDATQTYTVELVDQQTQCTYFDEVTVTVGPAFGLNVTNDTAICTVGEVVQLSALPQEPGTYTWNWSPNDGSLSTTNLPQPQASPFATTTYVVEVTSPFGCSVVDSVTVTVVGAPFITTVTAPDTICAGDPAQLQAQVFEGSGTYTFQWEPAASLSDATSSDPVATPFNTTNYTVTVTDLTCGGVYVDDVQVNVLEGTAPDLGPDQVLCPEATILLDAGSAQGWQWSTGANGRTITVDTPGLYWVLSSNGDCAGVDSVIITAAPDPGPLGGTVYACPGIPTTFGIQLPSGLYTWVTGDTTQSITVAELGTYGFTVTDTSGCSYAGTFDVVGDPLALGIVVPNVISPNGDGVNDRFEPQTGGNPDVSVRIFNRFGQEVFFADSLNRLWRGDKDGSALPDGTYFYVVRYRPTCAAEYTELHGSVMVVR